MYSPKLYLILLIFAPGWLFPSAMLPPPAYFIQPPPSFPHPPPAFQSPDEFFTSWGRLQATCEMLNRDNPVYKAIPYSDFFDQICKVARAFVPSRKDVEAVAKEAEPQATSLNLPRLRKLRQRMEQRARSFQSEMKLNSRKSNEKSTPKLTRKLRR